LRVMRRLCACDTPREELLRACHQCCLDHTQSEEREDMRPVLSEESNEHHQHHHQHHVIVWKSAERILPPSAQLQLPQQSGDDEVKAMKRRRGRCSDSADGGGSGKESCSGGGEGAGEVVMVLEEEAEAGVWGRERVHWVEWKCRRRQEEQEAGGRGDLLVNPEHTDASARFGYESGEELLEAVVAFLTDLRDDLDSMNDQGLIAFDCSPLVRRMTAAIELCISHDVTHEGQSM
jgi:hypothetical protein